MLSKFWMPLDEFTAYAIDGLKRGYVNIVTPQFEPVWNSFEKGRIEKAEQEVRQRT